MPFPCNKCQKEFSFMELFRVAYYRRNWLGEKVKLVRYHCAKCMGWES